MSEKEKILRRGIRHAHISFVVALVPTLITVVVLSGLGKGAVQVGGWGSVLIGAAVYLTLEILAERRDERRDQ
ncbi:MAG: hypothetical protein ABW065_12185 [Solirubrobacterales bacterium]